MDSEVLKLCNINKAFYSKTDKTDVLKGINLNVNKGEFITLLGSSGCGKTTTLRIIAGLETPTSGNVFLNGKDITYVPPEKRDVNTVFQSYALFPHMTVKENIAYGLKIKKVNKNTINKRVNEMLELVQLPDFGERYPSQLSGGQRQRIAIARAVINNPEVLLLDEPLGALDLKLRQEMQTELKYLQKKLGITFIYITHDQDEAINMSDRIAVMHNGILEQIGTPNDIYYFPKTSYIANFVGNSNLWKNNGKLYSIRHESVNFENENNNIKAIVTQKSFAGGQLKISFIIDDGQKITSRRYGMDSPLKIGDKVKIGWNKENQTEVLDNGT